MFNRFPLVVFFRKKLESVESGSEEITYLLYTLSIPLV